MWWKLSGAATVDACRQNGEAGPASELLDEFDGLIASTLEL